jgi:hypothetical protein
MIWCIDTSIQKAFRAALQQGLIGPAFESHMEAAWKLQAKCTPAAGGVQSSRKQERNGTEKEEARQGQALTEHTGAPWTLK